MYEEYQKFWNKYTAEYGAKTAIFLQVGSFYELYDIQAHTGQTQMNVKEIVDFLGIQLTIKKDDVGEGRVGLFAGFPDYVLHKWAGKLTGAGWTVIVVNQYKDKHGKVSERKVSRILTPATHIEALSGSESSSICGIWTDAVGSKAVASFDLSTGSTYTAIPNNKDELLHFLSVFNPRELIVFIKSPDPSRLPKEEDLRKQYDFCRSSTALHARWIAPNNTFEIPLAREQYLTRLYAPKSLLPVREYLHLDNSDCEQVLCALLRFVEDYQPSSFERLQQNKVWSPDNMLLMGNHALNQLQILPGTLEGQQGVLDLFKYTATTPFGKRALRTRLLSPSAQPSEIERRLKQIDDMLTLDSSVAKELYKNLRLIYDLPRLHRKMLCADCGAAELLALQSSYFGAAEAAKLLGRADLVTAANQAADVLKETFDLDAAAKLDSNITFLHASIHPSIATIQTQIQTEITTLNSFLTALKAAVGAPEGSLRYESTGLIPYKLTGTKTVLNNLRGFLGTSAGAAAFASMPTFTISTNKTSGGTIESEWLEQVNSRIVSLRERLNHTFLIALPAVCAYFCQKTQTLWDPITEGIESIDIALGLATESRTRKWCRPTIITGIAGKIKATGLRHPLIEGLLQRTQYVAHDVDIASQGWLVYGMNASGKSSLMKSIGIAIHLAQVGCYVPATNFELCPYRALFTRILNQDNLWAGLSSFAVEMSEMRDILRSADAWTMVLGDELCAGTESVSAKALVAAGIEWLAERRSSYVFATHLHGLTDVLPPAESLSLKVWHLKVSTDHTGKLIYHRNLEPGAGSSLYGLEVAKAMDVPMAFLDKAHKIRRRLLGTVADDEAPKSSWNSAVTRRACELCGCEVVADLEVHHVKARADGGSNHASNLMVLCAACHDRHHASPEGSVASVPLTVTSEGVERLTPAQEKKKKGLTDEENTIILKELADYPNLPIKKMVERLKIAHGIKVSEATIRKLR